MEEYEKKMEEYKTELHDWKSWKKTQVCLNHSISQKKKLLVNVSKISLSSRGKKIRVVCMFYVQIHSVYLEFVSQVVVN